MDILGGGLVGRPAQEIGKLFDVADILVVRLGAEPADRHVLDQSPAERTDGLVGHWGLLSWVRSSAPQSQDRTPASATPRDPSLATNYRGSGLVHRRILLLPSRSGGGRATERTPAVQPRGPERVKVPPSRHSATVRSQYQSVSPPRPKSLRWRFGRGRLRRVSSRNPRWRWRRYRRWDRQAWRRCPRVCRGRARRDRCGRAVRRQRSCRPLRRAPNSAPP